MLTLYCIKFVLQNVICRYIFKLLLRKTNENLQSNCRFGYTRTFLTKVNYFQVNPFKDRILRVFSSSGDGSMTFEDFLDMMSVFSDNAPLSIKIEYAFRIYGNIVMLTNNEKETKTGLLKTDEFSLYTEKTHN